MEQKKLRELLADMSLEEKIGQMIQLPASVFIDGTIETGPSGTITFTEEEKGLAGSVLGKYGAEELRKMQDEQMEKQPHHIPMLFMFDVIHGLRTIFPMPLALGCTFSPESVEQACRVAAKEASAAGLHVTFSPMADLVRDPRWGRVMESTGEDPYLNGLMARAQVRGYQGKDLAQAGNIASCLKHFAGYGAPEGGRDYDNVELSERTLRQDYLPAYAEAVREGCKMVMTSFNSLNRIPSSGNKWLLKEVLRDEMGFDGSIITDYNAMEEMIVHGIAEGPAQAAVLSLHAGVDMDMVSPCYAKYLKDLVLKGQVEEKLIDEAVWRLLCLKNELGLFENPYKDASAETEKAISLCKEHRELARKLAAESFVLLKNEDVLPLTDSDQKKLAFIGPMVKSSLVHSSWSFPESEDELVTIEEAIKKVRKTNTVFAQGSPILDQGMTDKMGRYEECQDADQYRKEAVEAAREADTVILCIGESPLQSGEGASRTKLSLPEVQMELVREVAQVNQDIIAVVFTGRPLDLRELETIAKAVLVVWYPGTESGNAIADVLFGKAEPGGRLAMSFPRSVGQVPVYYSHFLTGRPNLSGDKKGFCTGYIDENLYPLHPFGYGLTYTSFAYGDVELNQSALCKNKEDDVIEASIDVCNTGMRDGTETVQLYIRDMAGSVIRPVRELKGFQKVHLKAGEHRRITFRITEEMLRFYNIDMQYVSEPGEFRIYIGGSSQAENEAAFYLLDET